MGIEYYRILSVPEGEGWAQVYKSGSLFGVMFTKGKMIGDREVEIFRKIEEISSDETNGENLSLVLKLLKSSKMSGVFAWVVMENEERKVKIGGTGPVAISMIRGKSVYKLLENGGDQVMSGILKQGDHLILGMLDWVGNENWQDKNDNFDWGNYSMEMNKEEGRMIGGMVLAVGEMRGSERIIDNGQLIIEKKEEEKLAGDRIVGKRGWRDLLKLRQSQPQLIEGMSNPKKKKILIVGMVFLVLLVISVTFGLVKNQKDQKEAKIKAIFEPLEQKRLEAESVYGLNPVGARDLLRSVKEELELRTNGMTEKEILAKKEAYLDSWQKTWEKVAGEQKSGLELFFNLGLVRSELVGNRVTFDGKNLLILDSKLGTIVKLAVESKKAEVVMGKGEDKNLIDVAAGAGLVVGVSQSVGISALFGTGQKEALYDGSVKEIIAGDVFGENLYLLDKGSSEIWKYVLSGSSISDRRRWLVPGVVFDFSKSLDLAIDADIWVLSSQGEVIKFRRGNAEKFKLSDSPADFDPSKIAANDGSVYLALLDSRKSRVVLFDKKTGGYIKQLSNNDLSRALDLVYIDSKTLVVLIDGKLYRLPI